MIIFTWSNKGNVLNNKRPNAVQPEVRYHIVQALLIRLGNVLAEIMKNSYHCSTLLMDHSVISCN